MADITITIPTPTLTAGQYFKERHRLLPGTSWSGYTTRTNAAFTITGLSVGDYEFEFILVNADETECPPVYRTHTLVSDFECITFTSQMKKVNGLYHVEVSYTLPPGFTDPACGWEIEYLQNGKPTNKFTYTNLPAGGIIKIPCANIAGLLYIRAQLCNGRVKECHANDVAYFPDPPCMPITGVSISFKQQKNASGVCEFYLVVSFTQSVPATTKIKLDYREWNAIGGDRFNGTIQISPTATSFTHKVNPSFGNNPDYTRYYVTVVDECGNGLPVQIDLDRTCF